MLYVRTYTHICTHTHHPQLWHIKSARLDASSTSETGRAAMETELPICYVFAWGIVPIQACSLVDGSDFESSQGPGLLTLLVFCGVPFYC